MDLSHETELCRWYVLMRPDSYHSVLKGGVIADENNGLLHQWELQIASFLKDSVTMVVLHRNGLLSKSLSEREPIQWSLEITDCTSYMTEPIQSPQQHTAIFLHAYEWLAVALHFKRGRSLL